jgi:YD repeat-containing protein
MSDREQRGLRGPVRSFAEETTYPDVTDAKGKTEPGVRFESTTEYDKDGRTLSDRNKNSDGSQWVRRYNYDASGRLLKMESEDERHARAVTTYSYDQQGRLRSISTDGELDRPFPLPNNITFRYDEHGRKTTILTYGPPHYPSGILLVSSFDTAGMMPSLPGGGSTITVYDEQDRATELQERDVSSKLVTQTVRTYDAQGHVLEQKQILDGRLAPYSISYRYDAQGRVTHTSRRYPYDEDEIETTHNEHGDVASEITRRTQPPGETHPVGLPSYSEERHSYQYDEHENWIEDARSYRTSPDGAFKSSTVRKRKPTYY